MGAVWILLGVVLFIYLFFQVVFLWGSFTEDNSEIFHNQYYENDEGFLELEPFSLAFKIFCLGYVCGVKLREKSYIRELADENAGDNDYSNKFARKVLRDFYDVSYKESRKNFVMKRAKADAKNSRTPRSFDVPFENALYQDTYLKTVTNNESVENTVQNRFKALYEDEDLQPVSEEVFKEVLRKTA